MRLIQYDLLLEKVYNNALSVSPRLPDPPPHLPPPAVNTPFVCQPWQQLAVSEVKKNKKNRQPQALKHNQSEKKHIQRQDGLTASPSTRSHVIHPP